MGTVVSFKELPRKNVYELNASHQLTREFVLVLSDDTIASPVSETTPFTMGDGGLGIIPNVATKTKRYLHPTYPDYSCRKVTYTEGYEGSPYHVHVLCEYGLIKNDDLEEPHLRPAQWTFSATPGEVPALRYYDGAGNGTTYPLTNSAYDYFQGLVTQEALVVATVTKNFERMTDSNGPNAWLLSQNFVNDSTYLGMPAHTWKVVSVAVTPEVEEFEGSPRSFWKCVAELHYRQSGHNYQLPDVGFNFIGDGQKRRCMVFDFENSEWVPSPNPVGLDGSGAQTLGAPAILNRRVNPETDLAELFGTAPDDPPSVAPPSE